MSVSAKLAAEAVANEILCRLCVNRRAWHERSEFVLEDVVTECAGPACLLVNEVLEMRSCVQEVRVVDCGIADGESPATIGKVVRPIDAVKLITHIVENLLEIHISEIVRVLGCMDV